MPIIGAGSFSTYNARIRNRIYVETSLDFQNHDLYDVLNDIEEQYDDQFFFIAIPIDQSRKDESSWLQG